MVEKILVTLVSFLLFAYIFIFKMIKKNDTNYLIILILQAIGIIINFMQILSGIFIGTAFNLIIYTFSIILPIVVFLLEYKKINVSEIMMIFISKIYKLTNNNKKAKETLVKLISKYNDSYYGHKLLAEIYEEEGGMRKAIDEYVAVLDIKKDDYKSYHKISVLLNDLGKKEESIQMLKTLLKAKPQDYEANSLLGELLIEKKEYKEAIKYLNIAIKYNENKEDLIYNLAIAYTKINEFGLAKECYKKVVEIDHTNYNANFKLGQIALLYRDIESAESYFLNSAYKEKETKSYLELAKIYIIKNRKDKATLVMQKAIETDSNYYKIAQDEPILFPIKNALNKPAKENHVEYNESEKEKDVEEYLKDTYNLTKILNKQSETNKKFNEFKWNKN